ncbi:MAG: hypothetical protein WC551_10095 [Patescibacteria group bacterium]
MAKKTPKEEAQEKLDQMVVAKAAVPPAEELNPQPGANPTREEMKTDPPPTTQDKPLDATLNKAEEPPHAEPDGDEPVGLEASVKTLIGKVEQLIAMLTEHMGEEENLLAPEDEEGIKKALADQPGDKDEQKKEPPEIAKSLIASFKSEQDKLFKSMQQEFAKEREAHKTELERILKQGSGRRSDSVSSAAAPGSNSDAEFIGKAETMYEAGKLTGTEITRIQNAKNRLHTLPEDLRDKVSKG